MKPFVLALTLFTLAGWAPKSSAYYVVRADTPATSSTHTMNLQLGCPDDLNQIESWGPCWDDVAAHAITVWNTAGSRFHFRIETPSQPADPCDSTDGLSTIGWSDNLCGYQHGPRTLGIVVPSTTGTGDRDIILNGAFEWEAYTGPWTPPDPPDLHRAILHELGHIIGLGHPDEHGQSVTALMNSQYADIDTLQADDINGAIARHGAEDRNLRATFENPPAGGLSSGIGVISGWRCEANGTLTVSFDGGDPIPVVYGSERPDTASVCGDTGNGFVAIWNWGNLGEGDHSAVVYDDGVPFGQSSFTVGTSGEEFLRGVTAACTVPDFPAPGESGHFVWSEPTQHLELSHVGPSSMTEEPSTCEPAARFDGTWSIVGTVTDRGCAPDHRWSGSFTITDHVISGRAVQEFSSASHAISGVVATLGAVSGHLLNTFFESPGPVFNGTFNRNGGSGTWVDTFCSGTWTATKR